MRANLLPVYSMKNTVAKKTTLSTRNSTKKETNLQLIPFSSVKIPEILFISTYPPRECGIATYTLDLKNAIKEKFENNFSLQICALEANDSKHNYPDEVKYILNTSAKENYAKLATSINNDKNIAMVFLQHEFGLYEGEYGDYLLALMNHLKRPITTTFHTVLPNPDKKLKRIVRKIVDKSDSIIVMTHHSSILLQKDYGIAPQKIVVIPHGTHLISDLDSLKTYKIHLADRIILSSFGLLNEGKNIETALDALPDIIEKFPTVVYLIIGKTHPEVVKKEGEQYRDSLYKKVNEKGLQNNVRFINKYLELNELISYLLRTNIYLFTSKDPNQAVSGTLAYAMACGCPIISTPIPHAKELLDGAGVTFEFQNPEQLAKETIQLLNNPTLLSEMKLNSLHKSTPSAWQNVALNHIDLVQQEMHNRKTPLKYELPKISLDHIKKMTTYFGIIQFSVIAKPDITSGYTLDDNARALVAIVKHYELTWSFEDLYLIEIYLNFILYCQQEDGHFFNYVDEREQFMHKNLEENLEDANGRAIWALGMFIASEHLFDTNWVEKAKVAMEKSLKNIPKYYSPRAIAFSIKGLYFYNIYQQKKSVQNLIISLADNLISKYRGISDDTWKWYENYLTYANSILPEAMLFAAISSSSNLYKKMAKSSFEFLLSLTFKNNQIKVISNQGWHYKGQMSSSYGEQPIDVAYTILALNTFYQYFDDKQYKEKMEIAFDWFQGKNHLRQIVYNPKTGGCYDGLEEDHVNLNQGAESTISYLMARLVFEEDTMAAINEKINVETLAMCE